MTANHKMSTKIMYHNGVVRERVSAHKMRGELLNVPTICGTMNEDSSETWLIHPAAKLLFELGGPKHKDLFIDVCTDWRLLLPHTLCMPM